MYLPNWNTLPTPPTPWMASIWRKITATPRPQFKGETIIITADFGGSHSSSMFEVLTLLFSDSSRIAPWNSLRSRIRKSARLGPRRISYKSLNDSRRQIALQPFLEAADSIHGLCVAIAFHKQLPFLFSTPSFWRKEFQLPDNWTDRRLERALRYVHFLAMILGGLSRPDQSVYCIIDEDEIAANPAVTSETGKLLANSIGGYSPHSLNQIYFGTTATDPGDRFEEDLAAIPDLIAGAAAEVFTDLSKKHPNGAPRLPVTNPQMSSKSLAICNWFGTKSENLSKIGCYVNQYSNGAYGVGTWKIEEPPNSIRWFQAPSKWSRRT